MLRKVKFIKLSYIFFLLIPCLSGKIFAQNQPSPQQVSAPEITAMVNKQIEDNEKETKAILKEINELTKAGLFEKAAAKFKIVHQKYQESGQTDYIKAKLKELKGKENDFYMKWANYLESQANAAYLNRNWNESIKLANESIKILEKSNNVSDEKIKREQKILEESERQLANQEFHKATSLSKLLPREKQTVYDIDLFFVKADTFIKNKQYEKARDALEHILVLEPYNFKAMYMLKDLYKKLFSVAKTRGDVEIREKMAQVKWAYSQPISSKIVKEDEQLTKVTVAYKSDNKLRAKLQDLIIDKIDFDDATISSVITYLNGKSKLLDPEGTGINFVLRIDKGMENSLERVTMSMDEIPFEAAVKYICLATGLKYRIEKHAVIIGNEDIQELKTEFFTLKSDIVRTLISNLKIKKSKFKEASSELGSVADFGEEVPEYVNLTMKDLKTYFTARGVPFPENSMIAWDNRTSTLTATNTPENLRILGKLLDEIDINVPLVLIETKFVEINETDLEEFGFDVNINYSKLAADGATWAVSRLNPDYVVATNAEKATAKAATLAGTNPTINADDILKHYIPPGSSDAIGALVKNLTFSLNGNGGTGSAVFNMYALDQSGIAEVLSAPKVITKSGTTAMIRMVQEEYFPINWTTPEVSIVSNAIQVNQSVPEFEDPTDLGIRLEVTPTVSPNNYTILLELNPSIIDLVGWTDYSYDILELQIPINDITSNNEITRFPYNQPVRMPELTLRAVETTVKTFDGSTIVLGGMIKDHTVAEDDRIPVLGDIPLIGRLFRSEYEHSEKINLMIFLTSRLVNPDGTPIRDDHENGLFNFREY